MQFLRPDHQSLNPTKRRDTSVTIETKYWALCCVPDAYDARGAMAKLDTLCWTLDRGEPVPGDRIIVWQSKGKLKDGRRGIVGLGEVITPPQVMEESEAERQFWIGQPEIGPALRTRFRVLRLANLPIWENEHFDLLSNLNVARARGGTVFNVTPEQWEAVLAIARNEPETLLTKAAGGQGFGLTAAERKVIELHAQDLAEAFFRYELKYQVENRSMTEAYDLRCTRDGEVLFVEVKGTTGGGDTILLTRNEVALSRRDPKLMALFMVRNIKLVYAGKAVSATGGDSQVVQPWDVDQFEPEPVQFECRVTRS
jgi:hypothetical protein